MREKMQKFELYFKLIYNKMELIEARITKNLPRKDKEDPSPPRPTMQPEDDPSTTIK